MPMPRQRPFTFGPRGTTFRGRPCIFGHVGVRYVSNNMCVVCLRVKNRSKSVHIDDGPEVDPSISIFLRLPVLFHSKAEIFPC